jgi:endogenous inhibitor of DNA gyrase (YacG/DUF329 family)
MTDTKRDDNSQNDKSADPAVRLVSCPRCRCSTRYDETNEFRPFCSLRCKNDDIIAWAHESYKVPGPPVLDVDELDDSRAKTPPPDTED